METQGNFIDLYADTKSKPTLGMRQAIFEAVVGDEQKDEDPTVNELCRRMCELLGKEAAIWLPSGTMANQIALQVHCKPSEEVICDKTAHVYMSEGGGPACNAGVMIKTLDGDEGIFSAQQLSEYLAKADTKYRPRSRLVWVEQTSNLGGGTVWPLQTIREVLEVAKRHDLRTHMDGARLLNAVTASGTSAMEFSKGFDSVWLDFTKGLGCPVGAVLAGSKAFIDQAWYVKQRMGGSMRQAGIVASAALYSLDHHVDRLVEDHDNATLLAKGLENIKGIRVCRFKTSTNIVYFDVAGTGLQAADIVIRGKQYGVGIGAFGPTLMRAVTHVNISRGDILLALDRIRACLCDEESLPN